MVAAVRASSLPSMTRLLLALLAATHGAQSLKLPAVAVQKKLGRACLEVGLAVASCVPALPASAAPAAAAVAPTAVAPAAKAPSRSYLLFTGFPFPLGPFTERRTVGTELVRGKVYGFEQEIRLSGISANVRSTVFRTKDNHLVVYNPVAPTEEFLSELEAVSYTHLTLPTIYSV